MLHSFQNLLDLPSRFSLLEYPSLVPDIPSAVCGRSLVLLPKDISAQIGQNKVQIWHIMARGDLQRASFERKWEFSTFGFDTDVILGIPLQIIKKHVFQKKSRIQNIFWTCCVFLLEDIVWHFCTLSNAQEGVDVVHCETQKGWTVNTLSTQMSKQVSGFKQFHTGTTSPTEIVLFFNVDNSPLPRACFHTIVFCNRWCGMRQASGYLASAPSQFWGCSPLHC